MGLSKRKVLGSRWSGARGSGGLPCSADAGWHIPNLMWYCSGSVAAGWGWAVAGGCAARGCVLGLLAVAGALLACWRGGLGAGRAGGWGPGEVQARGARAVSNSAQCTDGAYSGISSLHGGLLTDGLVAHLQGRGGGLGGRVGVYYCRAWGRSVWVRRL